MLIVVTFITNSALSFALGLIIAALLGPEGFGQYALAAAIAVVLNTLFLDWIRLSTTRFYSERTRLEEPQVRETLDTAFLISSAALIATSAVLLLLGFDFRLSATLAALAPAMGLANGLLDYHTALMRAKADDRYYAATIAIKNLLSLVLMVLAAFVFRSPALVIGAFVISVMASLLVARHRLVDPDVRLRKPDMRRLKGYFVYGFPVLFASILYLLIPLWNRAVITENLGFAATGQFSLPYEIAIKIIQTVGSAADLVLFQKAVRIEQSEGSRAAENKLGENIDVVFAVLLTFVAGYFLVLPSFEATVAPAAYRGDFSAITVLLLPGLLCFGLIQAAVTQIFQLRQRTWPVIIGAGFALAANAALTIPLGPTATLIDYARAQSLAYLVALVVLIGLAMRESAVRPSGLSLAKAMVCVSVMMLAAWPIRSMTPGFTTLLMGVGIGGAAFGAAAFALNLCGVRGALRERTARRRA